MIAKASAEVALPDTKTENPTLKVAEQLFNAKADMVAKYAARIRHVNKTGDLLTKAMILAYSTALTEAITKLIKENNDEKQG